MRSQYPADESPPEARVQVKTHRNPAGPANSGGGAQVRTLRGPEPTPTRLLPRRGDTVDLQDRSAIGRPLRVEATLALP